MIEEKYVSQEPSKTMNITGKYGNKEPSKTMNITGKYGNKEPSKVMSITENNEEMKQLIKNAQERKFLLNGKIS